MAAADPARPGDDQRVRDARIAASGVRRIIRHRTVDAPPEVVWDAFVRVLWRAGGGVGPAPRIEAPGDSDGLGCTRWIPVGGQRGIRERIVEVDHPGRLVYRVVDATRGVYPVRAHVGIVHFHSIGPARTRVAWSVRYVPAPGAWLLVAVMTRFVVDRYLRVLERACAEVDRYDDGRDGRHARPPHESP